MLQNKVYKSPDNWKFQDSKPVLTLKLNAVTYFMATGVIQSRGSVVSRVISSRLLELWGKCHRECCSTGGRVGQLAGGYTRYHEKYRSLLWEYTNSLFSKSLFLSEMDNRKLPSIGHNPLLSHSLLCQNTGAVGTCRADTVSGFFSCLCTWQVSSLPAHARCWIQWVEFN